MTITRRRILAASAAASLAAPSIAGSARAETRHLKISHQFPGGTIDSGDFRDQLCRRFAAELRSEVCRSISSPVGEQHTRHAGVQQMTRRKFSHLTGAHE